MQNSYIAVARIVFMESKKKKSSNFILKQQHEAGVRSNSFHLLRPAQIQAQMRFLRYFDPNIFLLSSADRTGCVSFSPQLCRRSFAPQTRVFDRGWDCRLQAIRVLRMTRALRMLVEWRSITVRGRIRRWRSARLAPSST